MEMNDDSWHLVKSNPKVTAFIGGSGTKPAPITNKEVDIILQKMDDSKVNPTQKLTFEVGDSIRVVDGDTIHLNGEKIRFTGIDNFEYRW